MNKMATLVVVMAGCVLLWMLFGGYHKDDTDEWAQFAARHKCRMTWKRMYYPTVAAYMCDDGVKYFRRD